MSLLYTSATHVLLQSHSHRREETRPAPHPPRRVFLTVLELSLDPSGLLEKIKLTFPMQKKRGEKMLLSDNHPVVLNTEMLTGNKSVPVNTLY